MREAPVAAGGGTAAEVAAGAAVVVFAARGYWGAAEAVKAKMATAMNDVNCMLMI